MFAQYPNVDKNHNENVYPIYFKMAKKIISHFPLTNKLFQNFTCYEKLNYKQINNKVFSICTCDLEYTSSFDDLMKLDLDKIDDKLVSDCINSNSYYSYDLNMLENALSELGIIRWSISKYETLKKRLTSNEYYESTAVFLECVMAYKVGTKIGFKNIELEHKLENEKKPDIQISFNNKKIYVELTKLNTTLVEKTIYKILFAGAKHLYKKISSNNHRFNIHVDTTQLSKSNDHIDKDSCIKFLCEQIDKLRLDELCDLNINLHPIGYRGLCNSEKYSEHPLIDLPKLMCSYDELPNLIKNNEQIKRWAEKLNCSDLFNGPFTQISVQTNKQTNARNVVILQVDSFYSESEQHDSNISSNVKTALLEEKSFLNQIKRKIKSKIEKHQFKDDHPALLILYGDLWSKSESIDRDWSNINKTIVDSLSAHSCITGVLFYLNNYEQYKYIENPNANENIKLSESEIAEIFPN